MDTCKTCKHWEPPEVDGWKYGNRGAEHYFGRCKAAAFFPEMDEWSDSEMGRVRTIAPEYAETLHAVADGSGWNAFFHTRPEFGCVSHKKVDEA